MSMPARNPVPASSSRVKFREQRPAGPPPPPKNPPARIPRVARLLALAHKIDGMIHSGELKNWAEAARLIGVTRARMTQIANLLLIAPGIQESILDKESVNVASGLCTEHHFRAIITHALWKQQYALMLS